MIIGLDFRAVDFNAAPSLFFCGAAGLPLAAHGFAHALRRKLKQEFRIVLDPSLRIAVGIENFQLHVTDAGAAVVPKAALWTPWRKRDAFETPILSEMKASASFHLLIQSADRVDLPETLHIEKAIMELIPQMRLAGGSIFLDAGFRRRQIVYVRKGSSIDEWLNQRRSVQFLVDRRDLLVDLENHKDMLDALLDVLAIHRNEQNSVWHRKQPGWLVPLELGYCGVTEPIAGRPGARCPTTPCVVATPILGVGEFISGQKLTKENPNSMWSGVIDKTNNLYYLNAHPLL